MTAERVYMFWGLLPLLMTLAATQPGKPWTRRERVFAGLCVPVAFLLLAFVPRPVLPAAAVLVATLAASAAVLGAWLALVPEARPRAALLAAAIVATDAAALAAIYVGDAARLRTLPFTIALLAAAVVPATLARWLIGRRFTAPREGLRGPTP